METVDNERTRNANMILEKSFRLLLHEIHEIQ
jgi:hypothetical protein